MKEHMNWLLIVCAIFCTTFAQAGSTAFRLDDRGRFLVEVPVNTRSTITLPEPIKIVTSIDIVSLDTWECTWTKNGNKLWVKPTRLAKPTTLILLYREGASGPSSFLRLRLSPVPSQKKAHAKEGPAFSLPPDWRAAYENANPLHVAEKNGAGYRIGTTFFEKTMVLLPETAALEEVKDTTPNQEASETWSMIWLKGKNAIFIEPALKQVKPATYTIRFKNGSSFPLTLMPPTGKPTAAVVFIPFR